MANRQPKKKTIRYYSPKRRAVYAKGDDINCLILYELHGWICWICREPINRRLRLPSYWAATVDHVVPLAAGGTHTWDNVAPAHALCNFQKADRMVAV